MPYFAVMAAAMGLQQLKAWQDNKQKDALTQKQRELRIALQNREFERVRRLQAETQRISFEMEREAHEQRRQDIENEYDNAFDSLADIMHLEKWPLNIVPFIMKGESFGSRIRGIDVASIHCVFTPSNNNEFNRCIYSRLDMSIEMLMNLNWNSNTSHSVVYYGAVWKHKTNMGIPTFDNNDVYRLYADLRNVPFICITPYFKETTGSFSFKVRVWGMGADEEEANTKDITPPQHLTSEQLSKDSNFSDIADTIIAELTPYIVSIIGILTDLYYWKMYFQSPIFPLVLSKDKTFGFLNKEFILDEYYNFFCNEAKKDVLTSVKCFNNVKSHLNNSSLIEGSLSATLVEKFRSGDLICANVDDITLVNNFIHSLKGTNRDKSKLESFIRERLECTDTKIKTIELSSLELQLFKEAVSQLSIHSFEKDFFYFLIWSENIIIGRFGDQEGNSSIFRFMNEREFFIFYTTPLIDFSNESLSFYRYQITNNSIIKMKDQNFETRFGEEFARIGRAFGRTIDSLGKSSPKESVWDSPSNPGKQQSNQTDSYSQVINFFTSGVEENIIDFQHCEDLSIQTFLDWIDNNLNPFANKAYIVKGFLAQHKKYIYCIFFANDDKVFLSKDDKKKCFITSRVPSDLSNSFGENNLCVIPLNQ